MAIQNEWSPAHIDSKVFGRLYKSFFDNRQLYAKDTPINYMYKILLNGTYGKSNEETSFLYDPEYTCKTTINGQLLLSLLAEKLSTIKSLKFLQWNTDGLTAILNREDEGHYMAICEEWQKLTKLQLEYAYYETMVIRDVNNYISKTISGKIKYKGLFDYKDMPLNKNHSNKIIPIALEAHFINSIPIEQTIRNHTNIFDFCRGIKAKSNSKYLFFDSKGQSRVLQKVNRYFVCTPQAQEKGRIVKVYDDNRKALVEATKSYQKVVNKIDKDKMNLYLKEINYAFYEKETRKWIDVIENKKIELF